MSARTLVCVFLLVLMPTFARGQAADPAKTALIEEMLTLTKADRMLTQFLEQYKAAFSKGLEGAFEKRMADQHQDATKYQPAFSRFEDQMFQLMADRMSWDKLKPKFVAIYDETLSKQELADIVAFYKTPSGQSLLQKSPELIRKGSQAGQAQMADAMGDIQKMTASFLEDLKKTAEAPPKQ